ncbi:MAG: hypothetical protein R3F62_31140 [Planctomycetota bacterium]
MTDHSLSDLRRAWERERTQESHAALLARLVRMGELEAGRVELAADLGYGPAILAGCGRSLAVIELPAVAERLLDHSRRGKTQAHAVRVFACGCARSVLGYFESIRPESGEPRQAIATASEALSVPEPGLRAAERAARVAAAEVEPCLSLASPTSDPEEAYLAVGPPTFHLAEAGFYAAEAAAYAASHASQHLAFDATASAMLTAAWRNVETGTPPIELRAEHHRLRHEFMLSALAAGLGELLDVRLEPQELESLLVWPGDLDARIVCMRAVLRRRIEATGAGRQRDELESLLDGGHGKTLGEVLNDLAKHGPEAQVHAALGIHDVVACSESFRTERSRLAVSRVRAWLRQPCSASARAAAEAGALAAADAEKLRRIDVCDDPRDAQARRIASVNLATLCAALPASIAAGIAASILQRVVAEAQPFASEEAMLLAVRLSLLER